jgi:hypothetical protein
VRHGSRREGAVQLGTLDSDRGSQVREITMSRPSQSQTGAFFGILASALMLVLTAMALVSAAPPRPNHRLAQIEISEAMPTGLSLDAMRGGSAGR